MSEGDERARIVAGLLRQLWLGLSTYRLFPGNRDRPGFVAAVERIGSAARTALAAGPVDVEIRGDGFLLQGEVLPGDDATQRLALTCFERRVERLVVQGEPDADELQRTFSILSTPPEVLREAGGAEEALLAAGVKSILLSPLGPAPVEGADHVPEDMEGQAARRLPDADVLASQLMLEDLSGAPSDQAEVLLNRLRTLVSDLSVEAGREIDLHSTVHDVVTDLPQGLRRSLMEILVDRVREDPLAERLIGTMSNAELTRALVDLGRDGRRDPVQLARQLADAGVRHLDIVDLTAALEAGREEAGTILAGVEQLGIDLTEPGPGGAAGSVTDAIAAYLSATETDDVRTMQATLPRSDAQRRSEALLALRDYVALERDPERLGEVLHLWAQELERALRARDVTRVAQLVDPVREVLLGPDDERAHLFEAHVREALDPGLVAELVASGRPVDGPALSELLAPFDDLGVEALLDSLAEEEDRERRAHLLAALRQTTAGHLRPVMARLRDPRWFVVRNAAHLLGNAGGVEVLDHLAVAARHESSQVRSEAVKALLIAGGVRAIPHLSELAADGPDDVRRLAVTILGAILGPEAAAALGDIARSSSDRSLRRQAVDELAQGPAGLEVLTVLASGATRPKPPRAVRRHARGVLRTLQRATP